MITPSYLHTMAHYNAWQNESIYGAAAGLSDAARKEDRGAFFGSVHATLNHILWADQTWLSRFGASAPPSARSIAEGLTRFEDWEALWLERRRLDSVLSNWADAVDASALAGDLTWYSAALNREVTKPKALLVTHLFNHQTHHRGQVHAMLTGFGVKPGSTDLPFYAG